MKMQKYDYKTAFINSKVGASDVSSGKAHQIISNDILNVVNQFQENGYELFKEITANVAVNPGCLSGLFGAKTAYVNVYTLIFRKEI